MERGDKKKHEPLADMLPPVAHPANTVFVASCFALAYTTGVTIKNQKSKITKNREKAIYI